MEVSGRYLFGENRRECRCYCERGIDLMGMSCCLRVVLGAVSECSISRRKQRRATWKWVSMVSSVLSCNSVDHSLVSGFRVGENPGESGSSSLSSQKKEDEHGEGEAGLVLNMAYLSAAIQRDNYVVDARLVAESMLRALGIGRCLFRMGDETSAKCQPFSRLVEEEKALALRS